MVEIVAALETYELRHRVLNRGPTPADAAAKDDGDPDSAHFAIKIDGAVVATGTVRRRDSPRGGVGSHWQIRGMAVEPELRGRGLGTAVLTAITDHVAARGGDLVWCYVRIAAKTLYERHGFVAEGDAFDDRVAGTQIFLSTGLPSLTRPS
jgi:ribosomal protein S18 acetylase RimI-like enzyme